MASKSKRTEEPNEITRIEVPDYIAKYAEDDTSLDEMQQFRVLSRFKVIQSTSKDELVDTFGAGTVIISPANEIVMTRDESCLFVPVFFFVEYMVWSDLDDTSTDTVIARSFDKGSDIARRSRDPKLREEKYGPDNCYTREYREHLNFAGYIYGNHPCAGLPIAASFSKGEHWRGEQFTNQIAIRKQKTKAPLFLQVWEMRVGYREKGPKKKWWGIDLDNPEVLSVSEDQADHFYNEHIALKQAHADRLLMTDQSDADNEREEFAGMEDTDTPV